MERNAMESRSLIADLMGRHEAAVLEAWTRAQLTSASHRRDLLSDEAQRQQSADFLRRFRDALARGGGEDVGAEEWSAVRDVLDRISKDRAAAGFSSSETAIFVFSLKQPLFEKVQGDGGGAEGLAELWRVSGLLDQLGLYTTETAQRSRDAVIRRQQQELLELSTPVVRLWEGVVGVPLIGTLDSERTQVVMENLLQMIIETGSTIAIVDITGVPTVDTMVAQHLIKTVSAARLMGAECIISGIRPQIAQTIVHLGIDLADVTTKATLADALQLALRRQGFQITRTAPPSAR
jgi:rsbT co-antagonist protein RsbR